LFAFDELRARMSQIARGWQLGSRSERQFGTDWNTLWDVPLAEVKTRFGLSATA
jgi:ubiquinone biosynthesis protein COQ4